MSYYGSKWRAARKYAAPQYSSICEPFAGAAGYACHYPHLDVTLCELNPALVKAWRFLIAAAPEDVLALPLLPLDGCIDDLPSLPEGARELIQRWLHGGSERQCQRYSTMAVRKLIASPNTPSFWGAACRARIASGVAAIKHWQIHAGTYANLANDRQTWFIDPPYNNSAGRNYRYHDIDYMALGAWCRDRHGQVIVCENTGADWLPFSELYTTHFPGTGRQDRRAVEGVWYSGS